MLVHELVQPCLGNKAKPHYDTSVTRGRLHLIPSGRLSGKHFALSNYPICKSCVPCAYERNTAGKYKKIKTSNCCEKCNTMSVNSVASNIAIFNQKGNRLYDILVMKVAFSSFYFVLRVFMLTFELF